MNFLLTKQLHRDTSAGFTLIEMLVSIALFAVVLTMSVSTLLVLVNANGRAQAMQLLMTNLTFTLDSMTREIRTGYNWYCAESASPPAIPGESELRDCNSVTLGSGSYISIRESGSSLTSDLTCFSPSSDTCSHRVTYWFNPGGHGLDHGAIMRRLGTSSEGGSWEFMTGPEIDVEDMRVVVSGSARLAASDTEQPTATIYISGQVTDVDGETERDFDIQTTITQRLLDI